MLAVHKLDWLRMTANESNISTAKSEQIPAARRRIGGQTWSPSESLQLTADRTFEEVNAGYVPTSTSTPQSKKRRKRRKRAWYRRPIIAIPLVLVAVLLFTGGFAVFRAQTTISALHDVSALPESVTDNTADDDPLYSSVSIDTGPAMAALQEEAVPADSTGGGLFGSVRDAASDVSDIANGAAIASGVRESTSSEMTVLLMGVDARPGAPIDIGVRPDSIMILHINPQENSCRMLSVPRDTLVTLPGYGETKVNHALMVGGIAYQQLVIERFLGIEIDRYALVDFAGFEQLVNSVGGVSITVPQVIENADGKEVFAAGPQQMNGEAALAYARYRGDAEVDTGRVRRQQQIIRALAQEANGRDLVRDVNTLLPAVESHIRTNFSTAELVGFADQYTSLCDISGLTLDTLQGTFEKSSTPDPMFHEPLYYNVIDEAVMREKVQILFGG